MTNKRVMMNNNLNPVDKGVMMIQKKDKRHQSKKLKQMMKKRLIIRNLSFKVSEEELKEIFSKYGVVLEVNMPVSKDGRKKGFAFIRYKDTKSQIQAMKTLNFKKIYGRPIAIDFAVAKNTYSHNKKQKSLHNLLNKDISLNKAHIEVVNIKSEDTISKIKTEPYSNDINASDDDINASDDDINVNDDDVNVGDDDSKLKTFLKDFDGDKEDENVFKEDSDESSEEEESNAENESIHSDENCDITETLPQKKQSHDVSEGKTVFIRNISFRNSQEDLEEIMQEYGETEYCVLCVDRVTAHPKGTGFVKFIRKENADKLICESSKEPGILLDNRRLLCSYAVSKEELSKINNQSVKIKDKRNLRLLKCGLIMKGSKEAEDVSQFDLAKRAQLEFVKKQKLRNVNFFVSDTRLAIHNLPKNMNDKDLKQLFRRFAGKGANIKEARIMRDLKKTNAEGIPVSKGFGFVSFTEHEHALKAMTKLNNNPKVFTYEKRPIVEFSVENIVAVLSQQKKQEKIQMQNKKRKEEKYIKSNNDEDIKQKKSPQKTIPKKKNKMQKNKVAISLNKKMKQDISNVQLSEKTESKKLKQKQKKQFKNKNKSRLLMNDQIKGSLSELAKKYKEKLCNKL